MTRQENEKVARSLFDVARPWYAQLADSLVDDGEAAVEEAAAIFDRMIPDMAYVDRPDHSLAPAVSGSMPVLALYLALRRHGVDVHDFGNALLTTMAKNPPLGLEGPADDRPPLERFAGLVACGEASQKDAVPGEHVFEAFLGNRTDFDWGMTVKSCGVCHVFSKYDAMDLVPYMCAADDVLSDRGNLGLRRTGTIAVGADHCDFRYKRGGEPLHLATQYPDRVRIAEKG